MSPDTNESLRGSDSSNLYCLFQMPRPREVEGQPHGEPDFGRRAERVRQGVGHFNRAGCLFVDQIGKSLTSDPEPLAPFVTDKPSGFRQSSRTLAATGLTHGHQHLDLISDLASHYTGRPS